MHKDITAIRTMNYQSDQPNSTSLNEKWETFTLLTEKRHKFEKKLLLQLCKKKFCMKKD